MEKSWILLGMMGAGKSAVGRSLAVLSGREHEDTDLLLQHRLGRPIPQLFQIYGESTFRDHETSILKSLVPGAKVLSTGGGIVVRPENWLELRRLGTTVFLEVPLDELVERLERSKERRPLLEAEDWQGRIAALYETRLPLYRQADLIVAIANLGIDEVAAKVFGCLQ